MANMNYNVRFNGEFFQFNGEVTIATTLTNSSVSIDTLLDDFRSKRIIGLDVKWNSESAHDKVATLQLCHGSRCIIIQLLHLDTIPDSLRNLLSDPSIKFVGVDITEGIAKLEHDHDLKCWFAQELDSIVAVYATYQHYVGLGPSTQQIVGLSIEELESVIYHSDWSANILTNEQIKVSAIDAYASFAIGKMLFG